MKIVHFLPFFSPHTKGGTEIFLLGLAKSQIDNGHEIQILCPNMKEETASDLVEGIRVTYFPFPYGEADPRFLAGLHPHRTCAAFAEIVGRIDPDVIHLHGLYSHFLKYFETIEGRSKPRLVVTVHLVNVVCPNQTLIDYGGRYCAGEVSFAVCSTCVSSGSTSSAANRLVNRLTIPVNGFLMEHFGLHRCAELIPGQRRVGSQIRVLDFLRGNAFIDVLNPWFYEVFARNGFPAARLGYFESPFFEAANYIAETPPPLAQEPVRFLFVGRLSLQKGVGLLLETLQLLGDLKARFSVTLIGNQTDPALADAIQRLRQDGYALTLVGEVDNAAMPTHYRASDYLLFPSLKGSGDMLPLVIQEALENNLAVVSSDVPAVRALIRDRVNGYLFGAEDKGAFHAVLREIILGHRAVKFRYQSKADRVAARYAYYDAVYHGRSEHFDH